MGEKSDHSIVTVPATIRLAYATCIIQHLIKGDPAAKEQTITWLLSAFSALYPNEGDSLTCSTARFDRQSLDADLITFLSGQAERDTGTTRQVDDGTGTMITVPVMEPDLDPRTVHGVVYHLETLSLAELTAMLSVGLYVVVKEPNEDNKTAFTERRRKALMKQLRLDDT